MLVRFSAKFFQRYLSFAKNNVYESERQPYFLAVRHFFHFLILKLTAKGTKYVIAHFLNHKEMEALNIFVNELFTLFWFIKNGQDMHDWITNM